MRTDFIHLDRLAECVLHSLKMPKSSEDPIRRSSIAWRVLSCRRILLFVGFLLFAQSAPLLMASSYHRQKARGADVNDPVSASNGAFHFAKPLLDLGGIIPLRESLSYFMSDAGKENDGFYHSFFITAKYIDSIHVLFVDFGETGDEIGLNWVTDHWVLLGRSGRKLVLKESGGFYYLMDPVTDTVAIFEKLENWNGRLRYILDRNGNRLTYEYTGSDSIPTTVYEGDGSPGNRRLYLTTQNQGGNLLITSVSDGTGRQVQFTYDGDDILRTITDAMGHVTTLDNLYVNGAWVYAITRVTLPRGNSPVVNTVSNQKIYNNSTARVTTQTDAYGNATQLAYNNTTDAVTEHRPDGENVVYRHQDEHAPLRDLTDAKGKKAVFGFDYTNNQVSQVTDRLGAVTRFNFQAESGKIASIVSADQQTVTFTYTANEQAFTNPATKDAVSFTFYDPTQLTAPDGSLTQYTYDGHGNVLTVVEAAGPTWTFTYDERGLPLTLTNPEGGVTTLVWNADATLASRGDSDTGVTTFTYDPCKRLSGITLPNGKTWQYTYDANDHILTVTDPLGRLSTLAYDLNGNLTTYTDPTDHTIEIAFDLLERVTSLTDRRGKTTHYTYDSLGQLQNVASPGGTTITLGYDPRGWLDRFTLGGATWLTGCDDEGVVTNRTTPLGNVTHYQTDVLGRVQMVTDPLSRSTAFEWDALGRLARVTDPLAHAWSVTYDERGFLASLTLPTSDTVTFGHNSLGLVTSTTGPDGHAWTFDYSDMGRLESRRDPLGRTWTFARDAMGRLAQEVFPDGSALALTYDDTSNIVRALHSTGPDRHFSYDHLDRLIGTELLTLTRDAEGRVIATDNAGMVYGASYDDNGRLASATYHDGAFTVTYAYDPGTGLLSQVSDTLSGASVQFVYNADRRLTGVNRSNGANGVFTWDDAGQLTRLCEGTFLSLDYTYGADGRVTGVEESAPLSASASYTPEARTFTFDAASQLASPGFAYDPNGRMTASPDHTFRWDGASALVGIDTATLAYNGLGDLVQWTDGKTTTRYLYNYAIGFHPVAAESDGTQVLRYYVWTPEGRLLYGIDTARGNLEFFYHFDQTGSTLAITDASGAITDAYAYDTYGRLRAHTGTSPQPFTFVGRWGVRQERGSGDLYQMRARHYDAVTGRFLSPEPLVRVKEFNPYRYADLDPVNRIDRTGLAPDDPDDEESAPIGPVSLTQEEADDIVAQWARVAPEAEAEDWAGLLLMWQNKLGVKGAKFMLMNAPALARACFGFRGMPWKPWQQFGAALGDRFAQIVKQAILQQRAALERLVAPKVELVKQLDQQIDALRQKIDPLKQEAQGAANAGDLRGALNIVRHIEPLNKELQRLTAQREEATGWIYKMRSAE